MNNKVQEWFKKHRNYAIICRGESEVNNFLTIAGLKEDPTYDYAYVYSKANFAYFRYGNDNDIHYGDVDTFPIMCGRDCIKIELEDFCADYLTLYSEQPSLLEMLEVS